MRFALNDQYLIKFKKYQYIKNDYNAIASDIRLSVFSVC